MDPTTGRQLSALVGRRGQADPVVLADRPDGTVVRFGAVVAKAHAPDTDTEALSVRLSIAAAPQLAGVLLDPLAPVLRSLDDGRPVSRWPLGRPVDPDNPDSAPWEAAGELLARPPGGLRPEPEPGNGAVAACSSRALPRRFPPRPARPHPGR